MHSLADSCMCCCYHRSLVIERKRAKESQKLLSIFSWEADACFLYQKTIASHPKKLQNDPSKEINTPFSLLRLQIVCMGQGGRGEKHMHSKFKRAGGGISL